MSAEHRNAAPAPDGVTLVVDDLVTPSVVDEIVAAPKAKRARTIAAAGALTAVAALTACSPADAVQFLVGDRQGLQVEARAGANDGGGPLFRAEIVCSGEGSWRKAPWTNVEGPANAGGTQYFPGEAHWFSIIWCPAGHVVVAVNVGRSQS